MRVITVVILGFAATVHGHGTVVSPRSRNSVDYLVGVNTPKVMAWKGPNSIFNTKNSCERYLSKHAHHGYEYESTIGKET